jgi:hypothetical protein
MTEQTATFTPVTPQRERGSLMLPAALIALGGIFLLGNFGLIAPISIRSVLSLWPLIPIGIGLHLVFGRARPSLVLGLQLVALALGLALVLARAYIAPFSAVHDPAATQGALSAIPGAPEVAVTAQDVHFSVREIRLPAAEVNLTLRNDGALPHDLSIPALRVHISADSGESITTGLRQLPKGRYPGYCSVSGHADAGMELVVVVD